MRKRSISIAGHRTSLSLEPEFWAALAAAARARGLSLARLVGEIDRERAGRNLSSAIRVFLLEEAGRERSQEVAPQRHRDTEKGPR